MPLKHLTETVLVVFLALATIATGIVVSTLPHIPEGFFPWAIVFVATVLYPAVLYPLLKQNRADYAFRALHFAPVGIALLWMMIEVAALKEPRLIVLHGLYTWGWTVLSVGVTFLLLVAFCLQVIRRRVPRIAFLLFLFTPFLVSAFMAENYTEWKPQLAALLWEDGMGGLIAQQSSGSAKSSPLSVSSRGEKNLRSSSVPAEEEWRKKLRAVEQGSAHSVSVAGPLKGVKATSRLSSPEKTGKIVAKTKSKLPKSGGEMEAMVILFIALYAGTVHLRAKRALA